MKPDVLPIRLLFLTAEQWPTFRPDVSTLFGKYLPRYGIFSDLVTERGNGQEICWHGGEALLCNTPQHRAGQYLVKFWHQLRVLAALDDGRYQAIQVRDMSLIALIALCIARIKGIPFFYWLSYPQSEGQIARARSRGLKGGMRFWFPLIQGILGKWLLYRIVLPYADHVFVQSRWMQAALETKGIPAGHMTPVPMAVDLERTQQAILPVNDDQLAGKQVLVYLGTLDKDRNIEILLQMLSVLLQKIPDLILLLVGDTRDAAHRSWLKEEAEHLGVARKVIWTGWLDTDLAWRYAKMACIGMSPIPRGNLLDMASPTKAVEYMALGLPVVANDNPDQAQVIAESGAGICVPLQAEKLAEAVLMILQDASLRQRMAEAGLRYVADVRSYQRITEHVARTYKSFVASVTPVNKT